MAGKLKIFLLFLWIVFATSCKKEQPDLLPEPPGNTYESLPENLVATDDNMTISARYVDPVTRYTHGILGDKIEAGGLLVIKDDQEYYYKLDEMFVFEDLQPRLYDVDLDGEMEFITIQTSLSFGAGVYVYKIINGRLQLYVKSEFIGIPYRWLNIAAIDDLDNDGNVEIAWIETPHIGGTLKIARLFNDSLWLLDEEEGVSNHQISSRNLCLSVVTTSNISKNLYVPNDPHDAIIGFRFQDEKLIALDTVILNIDPALPLFMQYDFQNRLEDKNCIYIPE